MPEEYVFEICSGRAAWQVIPTLITAVEMEDVAGKIETAGWLCTLRNRLCYTFTGEVDLTLFPSGKLLIKTADEDLAAAIAQTHLTNWIAST